MLFALFTGQIKCMCTVTSGECDLHTDYGPTLLPTLDRAGEVQVYYYL